MLLGRVRSSGWEGTLIGPLTAGLSRNESVEVGRRASATAATLFAASNKSRDVGRVEYDAGDGGLNKVALLGPEGGTERHSGVDGGEDDPGDNGGVDNEERPGKM